MTTAADTAEAPAQVADARPLLVRRAAVLGAGTMGSRIAAHLANAGIPTLLLDLPPKSETAEPLAKTALGAKFDIRKFHDGMLLAGAVPLSLMPGLADTYIASARGP